MVFGFLKKKSGVRQVVKSEATMDLADYLIRWGFSPEKAMKEAKDFWNKHDRKLDEMV